MTTAARASTLGRRATALVVALVTATSVTGCGGASDAGSGSDRSSPAAPTSTTLAPGAFADAVRARDLDAIRATLAEDIELYGPVFAEPFVGRAQVGGLFGVLLEAFEGVEIIDEVVSGDRFVLAFRAEVGGQPIEVVDLLSFDDDGRIETFTVTARPLAGIQSLAAAVGPHLPELGMAPP